MYTHCFGGAWGPPWPSLMLAGIDMTVLHRGHIAKLVFCGRIRMQRQQTQVTLNCWTGVTVVHIGHRTLGAPIGYASVTWQPWQVICPVD